MGTYDNVLANGMWVEVSSLAPENIPVYPVVLFPLHSSGGGHELKR